MIDLLSLISLAVDAALVVLILIVQLIIYPSFLYYNRDNLVNWHNKYTGKIAVIVGPLMVIQLLLAVYTVFTGGLYMIGTIYLVFVLSTWVTTALIFVPLHKKVTQNTHTDGDLRSLVSKNWIRVVLWVIILCITVLKLNILQLFSFYN